MKELHKRIKEEVEKNFWAECNELLIVEFVPDVDERAEEIVSESKIRFVNPLSGGEVFGMFVPPVKKNDVYHILLLNERDNYLEIMTAQHELEHAILYFRLLKTFFAGDSDELYKGFYYMYFQIFSEFSAYRKGMSNYLRNAKFDNQTLEEVATILLEDKYDFYSKNADAKIKEICLLQNSMLFGNIVGALDVVNSDQILDFLKYLDKDEKALTVYSIMIKYRDDIAWYNEYFNAIEDYVCS